jgi:hypothetical protein
MEGTILLRDICKLYTNFEKNIYLKSVKCSELFSLAEQLSSFNREIIEKADKDTKLLEIYNYLSGIFFTLCRSFLPYSHVISKNNEKEIIHRLLGIKNNYPYFFDKFGKTLAMSFKEVLETEHNYMTEFLCDHINKHQTRSYKIALVTKRSLSPEEKELLNQKISSILNVTYYTENSFRKSAKVFDEVIFVGSPSYFGSFAVNTLKAYHTYFVFYEMFSDNLKLKSPFLNSDIYQQNIISTINLNVKIHKDVEKTHKIEFNEDYLVKSSIQKVLEEQNTNTSDDVHHLVKATVVLLENDRFLFVSDETKIRVLTPNIKKDRVIVNQITLKDLEEDDFIIIRNERDNSLIAEVADQEILKEEAKYLRALQKKWKKRLRYNVSKKGIMRVSEILTNRYKMTTASPQTVRFWCNEESICPTELPVLLQALKFDENEVILIYQAMKQIQIAHREAGRIISRKLMEEIKPDIFEELQQKGSITFKSSNFNGASFNIERVVAINRSKHYDVLQSNLMKVYHRDL